VAGIGLFFLQKVCPDFFASFVQGLETKNADGQDEKKIVGKYVQIFSPRSLKV
jgi:hypothetical protein